MKVQKTTFLLLLAIIIGVTALAQAPQQFAYQAVLRDEGGEPISSEDITVNVAILQEDGTVVFSETHHTSTNPFGLFTLHIGSTETMAGFDWADGPFFLEVRYGDQIMGLSELLSVPYALYSITAGDTFSGDYHDLENLPNLDEYISIAEPQPGDLVYYNQGTWHALPIGQEDQILITQENLPQWGSIEDIKPIRYAIDLESAPPGAARLVGSGEYEEDTEVIIRAFTRDGFLFLNWTDENDQEVSNEETFTHIVGEDDITYVANFDVILYNLSVDIIPAGAGAVTGTGEYPYGYEVTLEADPAEEFTFVKWTDDDGEELGTAGTLTVTMPLHDLNLNAHFELTNPDLYLLDVIVEPEGAGSIIGTGQGFFPEDQQIILHALSNEGYRFVKWTTEAGEELDIYSPRFLEMPATDLTIIAHYQEAVTVTDYDGNVYPTTVIGEQRWMAENLRTTHYSDGTAIVFNPDNWNNTASGAYTVVPFENIDGIESEEDMVLRYGYLYNWFAVADDNGLCPAGWHAPQSDDWDQLITHLLDTYGYHNSQSSDDPYGAGNVLSQARQVNHPWGGIHDTEMHPRWNEDDIHYGMDIFGFNAKPGGLRMWLGNNAFSGQGNEGFFWHSSGAPPAQTPLISIASAHGATPSGVIPSNAGASVRCVKDLDDPHYSVTVEHTVEGSVRGQGYYEEGAEVTLQAVPSEGYVFDEWTDENDEHISHLPGYTFVMPDENITLNAHFTVRESHMIPGEGVTDIDGNHYATVIIGDQEWMAENLRTTHYADGTEIAFDPSNWSNTTEGAYVVFDHGIVDGIDSAEEMAQHYGLLYNWFTVTNESGVCPEGWHVPTSSEWNDMFDYIFYEYGYPIENTEDVYGVGNALRLARQEGHPWGMPYDSPAHPKWDPHDVHYGLDLFGFKAVPGGLRLFQGAYGNQGIEGFYWHGNGSPPMIPYQRFSHNGSGTSSGSLFANNGHSIRCIRTVEE